MIENGLYKTHWERTGCPTVYLQTPVTMSDWDHLFPRFRARYSGWNCTQSVDLETPLVAEPLVAVQMATMLQTENPTWWVRVEDLGTAKHPTRRTGTPFYSLQGRRGVITTRQRFNAYVQWDDADHYEPGVTYPLEDMRDTPPPPPRPIGSTWLYPTRA
ncbi:hypothetical protein OG612_45625 (plasmid) [Streptomyces sp. NBC_01527]|uniref:hypothetical protein n=1 Tax=Streptomyces sp. NBC_01527 TaxID=2903894 RepID=UPI002F914731